MILSGNLNEKITIQKRAITYNEHHQKIPSWSTLTNILAEVRYNSGSRTWDSDININLNTYNVTFTFRYIDNFGYDCRILYDGDYYTIVSIEKIPRKVGYRVITERREHNDG